jgi:sugar phosphate permease
VFGLTWLAYASYYLGRKGFSVTKVAVARELGLGTPVLAAIDTAFLVAYAVGQLPSGVLADRIGARKLVAAGLLGSALACAAFGASGSALVLALCFALNGLAQSTGWPGTTKAMAEWTPVAERGRVMGAWCTCYQVGGIAATALAAYLLARSGWRSAFFVPSLWLALMAGVVLWLLPPGPLRVAAGVPQLKQGSLPRDEEEPPARAPGAPKNAKRSLFGVLGRPSRLRGGSSSPSSHVPPRVPLRAALGNRVLYSYGACYFCLKLIRYSLLFWLPFYLHTAAGFGEVESGYLSISFELGGVLGSAGLGWLSDRVAARRASVALGSLLALTGALWLYAQLGAMPATAHFALMALIGALLFGPDALLSGAAAQDAASPAQAATATGLVNGIGSLGALLQGPLTVGVQAAVGWQGLFYAFFALSLLACACLLPALRGATSARTP